MVKLLLKIPEYRIYKIEDTKYIGNNILTQGAKRGVMANRRKGG